MLKVDNDVYQSVVSEEGPLRANMDCVELKKVMDLEEASNENSGWLPKISKKDRNGVNYEWAFDQSKRKRIKADQDCMGWVPIDPANKILYKLNQKIDRDGHLQMAHKIYQGRVLHLSDGKGGGVYIGVLGPKLNDYGKNYEIVKEFTYRNLGNLKNDIMKDCERFSRESGLHFIPNF